MFFEQLANSGSYNRIIAVNRVGGTKSQNVKTSASKSEASQTEISDLSSETPNSLLLGTARLRQRRKWVKWVRCQGMYEGFENGPGNWLECVLKLGKNRQDPHILCVQLSFLWSAMLSWALASFVSPNSPGAGLFTVLKVLYQSKNLILPAVSAAAVLIFWDFRCY